MCEGEAVTAPASPPPSQPDPATAPASAPGGPRDAKIASIAWAVATIVVALVVGLIAWLALGDRGRDAAAPAAETAVTDPTGGPGNGSQPGDADHHGGDHQDADQPDAQELPLPPEPSEEVAAMLLDLPRRDAADPMAVGDVDAPVVMIEYADYRCPYCARFHLDTRPGLSGLVEDGTLRIEFRDLVIFEETSQEAAVAARAAAAQDHLAEYQSLLFARSSAGQAELERVDFLAIAQEAGVPDLAAFETALDDPELDAQVRADTAEGQALGVRSTPTLLVNTAVVQGAYEADYFVRVVERELEKVQQES